MNGNDEPATKPTILIVDDTPANITLLTELLKDKYRLKVAISGAKALEALGAAEPPDLVLLDIMMPGMDGYEVCSRMKNIEAVREVPVIFLSALNETVDKVKAFHVGGVDYVTKPFQLEEVLARVETHLEIRSLQKQLIARHAELQENFAQLSELSALKDEFLRIASHDLKNPLMCVIGFSYIIANGVPPGTEMKPEMHNFVTRIADTAKLMQKIIEDFLDFRAMEDGQMKLDLANTDLGEIVRLAIGQNQAYADEKSIPITFEEEVGLPPARVDAGRIRQVVENFIGNAIKFSLAGEPVTVRTSRKDGSVLLEVADSGPGLKPEDQEMLFVKYAKLSNKPTGGEKSSGLGLAICKKIVSLHEGRIGAQNNPGAGTTFWFEVPAGS